MRLALAIVVVAAIIAGCTVQNSPKNIWNADSEFITTLQQTAATLADREIKAMQAAEYAYKDTVETYDIRHPIIVGATHSMKWYREYTDYALVDIYRSDSLLEPIIIELEYRYDYMRTTIRASFHYKGNDRRVQAEKAAAADTEYVLEGKGFVVRRRYQCDAFGNVVSEFPPLARRDLQPGLGNWVITEGYSPRDPAEKGTGLQQPPTQGIATPTFPGANAPLSN